MIKKYNAYYNKFVVNLNKLDFLPLFAIRLYLAPVFIMAGLTKYRSFDDTAQWFGNADFGLGLPFASFWVAMVIVAELIGGVALLLGVATRLFGVLLAITMAVAMLLVHLKKRLARHYPNRPCDQYRPIVWRIGTGKFG